jgi:adenylosuccinate synthase
MALFKEKEIKQDKKKNAFEVPPIQPRQTQPIQNENNNQFNIQTIKTPQINPNYNPFSNPIKEESPEKRIPTTTTELSPTQQKEDHPFFVRIDKFNESKEQFEKINQRLNELEEIIKTLEEIKEKEERELNNWKEDSKQIKDFLVQIDKEIFGRL